MWPSMASYTLWAKWLCMTLCLLSMSHHNHWCGLLEVPVFNLQIMLGIHKGTLCCTLSWCQLHNWIHELVHWLASLATVASCVCCPLLCWGSSHVSFSYDGMSSLGFSPMEMGCVLLQTAVLTMLLISAYGLLLVSALSSNYLLFSFPPLPSLTCSYLECDLFSHVWSILHLFQSTSPSDRTSFPHSSSRLCMYLDPCPL